MQVSDFLAVAECALDALRATTDRDWTVRAGSLDWDVTFTLGHTAHGVTKWAMYLPAGATKWSPLVVSSNPTATNDQLLDGLDISARGLAFVAAHVDAGTVAFHQWAMGDTSSFLARAANEVLIHSWDVAQGLGTDFAPAPVLCTPILRRSFPWADETADPWVTLLTANGRTGSEPWIPFEAPLAEWDGHVPVPRPPATAWQLDQSGRWTPAS